MRTTHPDLGTPLRTQVLRTHFDLPCEDGAIVMNSQQQPQAVLLADSRRPLLERRHPDGNDTTLHDVGIYLEHGDTAEQPRVVVPDWASIPNAPPNRPDGTIRRSYAMWDEDHDPEIVSDAGVMLESELEGRVVCEAGIREAQERD